MNIVKETIYHKISCAVASGAGICPHCLLQLAVLAPNRRLSDLLLLYAYLIKLQQEEGVRVDPEGVHALRGKILRLCREETEKAGWVRRLSDAEFGVVAYSVNIARKEWLRGLLGALEDRGWRCIGALERRPGDPGRDGDTHLLFYTQPAERITEKTIVPGYLQDVFEFGMRVSDSPVGKEGWTSLNIVRAKSFFDDAPYEVMISFFVRPKAPAF